MIATVEPTKIEPLHTPKTTATLDEESSVINVTVNISRDAGGGFHHDVAALSAAGPTGSNWIVSWTLAPNPDLSMKFNTPGLTIQSIGDGVTHYQSRGIPLPGSTDLDPTRWQLAFMNQVPDVNVIRYDLSLDVRDLQGNPLTHNVIFDPTIAVVKDPIEG